MSDGTLPYKTRSGMNTKFPKLPKSLLKPPKGFKTPKVKDFKEDMQRLGEEIAEDFKELVIGNIEENAYGFSIKESTAMRKGSQLPLIDSHTMVDSIYRDGTKVSVKDTPRSDSPLTNLQLAIVHEYGVKDKGIPARPVWRMTFSDFRESAKEKIDMLLKKGKFDEGSNNQGSHEEE